MASRSTTLLFAMSALLLFQTLVTEVAASRNLASVEDDKAYSPRGHGSPPKSTPCPTPSHGSGSGSGSKTPPSGSPPSGSYTPPGGSGSGSGSGSSYTPPSTDPGTPYLPGVPMPPSIWLPSPGIPNIITGTCDYWRTHPQSIWAICGYWNTIGRMLGLSPPSTPNLSLLDALKNTRTDGFGDLYREGTASFLNSLASQKFVFSSSQVRNAFASALVSDQAAAAQAQIFKRANEGRL